MEVNHKKKISDISCKKILLVNSQIHFIKNGKNIYAKSIADSFFWCKYLSVFDQVYVLARVKHVEKLQDTNLIISNADNVHFIELPDFAGLKGYIRNYFKISKIIRETIKTLNLTCAIIRSPNSIGYKFLKQWKKKGKSYGMEIVANYKDPYYYNIDVIHSLLFKMLDRKTEIFARDANAVSYVTKNVLQNLYPTRGKSFSCSDIDIKKDYFYERKLSKKKELYTLIHVSTLEMDSKGHEEFLRVLKILIEEGYNLKAVVIGGGRYKGKYENMAYALKINDYVVFKGHIGEKEQIRKELINADIFLFPTRTEGLPRVLIEAMACSLPCISSNISTICELFSKDCLCNYDDVESMVIKVKKLIDDIDYYNFISEDNYRKALKYEYSNLESKRIHFYKSLIGGIIE